jgi:ferritin
LLGEAIQDAITSRSRTNSTQPASYLLMAAYCESANLSGFARWMQPWSERRRGMR